MGIFDQIKKLFGAGGDKLATAMSTPTPNDKYGVDDLAQRLSMSVAELQAITPAYHQFTINKRTGGQRTITAPTPPFKAFQRRLLNRLFNRLPVHSAAMGFRKGRSIADHALLHAMRPLVIKMDIRDFFTNTKADRVQRYFRRIGWDAVAAAMLATWCTHDGGLPQGAPTSPVLSNAVNKRLDDRLARLVTTVAPNERWVEPSLHVEGIGGFYSRYADDITISFAQEIDDARVSNVLIYFIQEIVEDEGYKLHTKKKLRIMRKHDRQIVTGLVINDGVRLPRETRRWLRAVRHRKAMGMQPTLTDQQLAGWSALETMVENVIEKKA